MVVYIRKCGGLPAPPALAELFKGSAAAAGHSSNRKMSAGKRAKKVRGTQQITSHAVVLSEDLVHIRLSEKPYTYVSLFPA